MKVLVIPIVIGALGPVTKELVQGLEDLVKRVETIQNVALLRSSTDTEKSTEDLMRLAVTQTSVRNHRLKVVRKNRKGQ